jgi:hypothetical protein
MLGTVLPRSATLLLSSRKPAAPLAGTGCLRLMRHLAAAGGTPRAPVVAAQPSDSKGKHSLTAHSSLSTSAKEKEISAPRVSFVEHPYPLTDAPIDSANPSPPQERFAIIELSGTQFKVTQVRPSFCILCHDWAQPFLSYSGKSARLSLCILRLRDIIAGDRTTWSWLT